MKRRDLIKLSAGAVAAVAGSSLLTGCGNTPSIVAKKEGVSRVVVVGGGPGGIAAAQAVRNTNADIEVILVEKNDTYITCFGSNWLFNGIISSMDEMTFDYKNLPIEHNIQVIKGEVTGIDTENKLVKVAGQDSVEYDRVVVSPGISFRWDLIDGLDETTIKDVPHAWKAGEQTEILKAQLVAMPDDGLFVICVPPSPMRCGPGPYERASLVANYMQEHKPNAKVMILDSKNRHSKFDSFRKGWKKKYNFGADDSILKWVSKDDGGEVQAIDPKTKIITTKKGKEIKADVVNYIPAQKANIVAANMGLVDDSGWCPIKPLTFESTLVANVHVVGDASSARPMPKSAFAAESQGRNCGAAVANLLSGKEVNDNPRLANQCFSLITPDYGISVVAGYGVVDGKLKTKGGGFFPIDGNYAREALGAQAWYDNIVGTLFK